MKLLADFLPIIIFFVVFKIAGIYWATGAAMVISLIQVIFYRLKTKKYDKMQVITLVLILVLGGATIALHDPLFIKWKPTLLYWVFALVFIGGHLFGDKPILQRMMGDKVELPAIVWKKMSYSWIGFFIIVGFINIYVAYHYDTDIWVNFKLFGILGLTVVFVIAQALFLTKHIEEK